MEVLRAVLSLSPVPCFIPPGEKPISDDALLNSMEPPTNASSREGYSMSREEKEEQETVWREVFRMFDRDGNGRVSAAEVGVLLRGLDLNPTQQELQEIIGRVDKNGTGQIEWEEFADFMRQIKLATAQEQMEEMLRAFKLFDKNNDDHIDVKELVRVVTSMGEKLTQDEAMQMIRVADVDKDGRINYKEFVKFIMAPCL